MLVKDTSSTKSDGQSNEKDIETACKKDNPKSTGLDTFEFICQERLAANEVIIKWAGSSPAELAEVVVVGKTWGKYLLVKFRNLRLFELQNYRLVLIIYSNVVIPIVF